MIPRWEDGVADWVVLHGGAMAVLRVPSLAEAAQLAQAMAQIAGLDGALMMLTDGQLTVRLTRDMWQLEERHIELAHAVSAVAREHGAVADRTLAQEVQFAVAAQPDAIDVGFWRAVPRVRPAARAGGGDGGRQRRRSPRPRLDGVVDDSGAPAAWILADRSGNRVCIAAWPDGASGPTWSRPSQSCWLPAAARLHRGMTTFKRALLTATVLAAALLVSAPAQAETRDPADSYVRTVGTALDTCQARGAGRTYDTMAACVSGLAAPDPYVPFQVDLWDVFRDCLYLYYKGLDGLYGDAVDVNKCLEQHGYDVGLP